MKFLFLFLISILTTSDFIRAQEYNSIEYSNTTIGERECTRLSIRWVKKLNKTKTAVKNVNDKYLKDFFELEDRVIRSLCLIDEIKAESHFKSSAQSYRRFEERLVSPSLSQIKGKYNELDTLSSAIDFLDNTKEGFVKSDSCKCRSFQEVRVAQVDLKRELRRSEVIQDYINDRTDYLSRMNNYSDKLETSLLDLRKNNFYLEESLKNRVSILNRRSSFERVIFQKLNSTSLFKDFVNAQQGIEILASVPKSGSEKSVKLSINKLLADAQDNIGKSLNAKKMDFLEDLKAIHFDAKKDTLKNLRKGENERKKREWKPNPYKSKRIIERFSYGLDFQVTRRTQFLPSAGTIAGSLIFNCSSDFSVTLNLGAITSVESLNFAGEFDMPQVSNDGLTVGFGADRRLFRKVFLTGSLEMNNRIVNAQNGDISNTYFAFLGVDWNTSALVGLKLRLPSGSLRQQTFSIVYDVLHGRTGLPPFSVRIGFDFNSI